MVKLFADQRTAAIELADMLREFGVYRRNGETLTITEDDIRTLTRMAAKRQIALGRDYRFMITPAPVHVMRKGRQIRPIASNWITSHCADSIRTSDLSSQS